MGIFLNKKPERLGIRNRQVGITRKHAGDHQGVCVRAANAFMIINTMYVVLF
jgi:hypothetical protein